MQHPYNETISRTLVKLSQAHSPSKCLDNRLADDLSDADALLEVLIDAIVDLAESAIQEAPVNRVSFNAKELRENIKTDFTEATWQARAVAEEYSEVA